MWANSLSQFLNMGGYASYVWPAYGIGLSLLALNIVIPLWQTRRLKRQLRQRSH